MSKIGFKELSLALVDKYGLEREAAEQFVEKMFDVLSKGIETDRQVKVKGLGTFKVVPVASRKSVDVNTGEPIVIEGRDKVSFTPDSAMRELVNRPFSQFETVPINDGVDFTAIDEHFANVEEGTEDIIMTDNDETVTEPITTDAAKQDDKMAETSEGEAASGATNVLGTQPDETASTKNDENETTYGKGIDDHSTHQGGTPEETVVAAETVVSDNEPIQTTEPMKPEESFTALPIPRKKPPTTRRMKFLKASTTLLRQQTPLQSRPTRTNLAQRRRPRQRLRWCKPCRKPNVRSTMRATRSS